MLGLQAVLKYRTYLSLLVWVAVLCCLIAGASIHSHITGWHTQEHCTACTFEDAVAHGATTTIAATLQADDIPFRVPFQTRHVSALPQHDAALIRAPPLFS